jgi:hypothetical protein
MILYIVYEIVISWKSHTGQIATNNYNTVKLHINELSRIPDSQR